MATEQTRAAMRDELRRLAEGGAALAELVAHLDDRDRRLGRGRLSEEQCDELQLYCWALHKERSGGLWGTVGATFEEEIGA
jgi:hypothetical protein